MWTFGSFSAVINEAAINVNEQLFVWIYVFVSLGYASRSEMARTYGRFMFNTIRMPEFFRSDCTRFPTSFFTFVLFFTFFASIHGTSPRRLHTET